MKLKARQLVLEPMPNLRHGKPGQFHLTEIIRDLDSQVSKKSHRPLPDGRTLFEIGHLWEQVIGDALWTRTVSRRARKQVPLELDGILMTIDLLQFRSTSPMSRARRVIECKATRRSFAKAESDFEGEFRTWLWQVKGYCYAAGVLEASLIVLFINGDWRERFYEMPVRFDLEFEPDELDDNWQMLTAHAERMRKRVAG